jgi:hypothetical protein
VAEAAGGGQGPPRLLMDAARLLLLASYVDFTASGDALRSNRGTCRCHSMP